MARPRYQRITVLAAAVGITLVTVAAGVGLLPSGSSGRAAYAVSRAASTQAPPASGAITLSGSTVDQTPRASTLSQAAVPENSGEGRRIVFDISDQRVWLVEQDETVRRTYLVSGSLTDNLQPGSYQVYSRSRHAVGVDDSGTMQYMVRFAHGPQAAIGFHDIPVDDGEPVQTRADLGTPQSHGCIRQWRPDALALWRFAPVGTEVTVTA